jgi:polyvinyl alcohol dehydrogenase (cytochrome)
MCRGPGTIAAEKGFENQRSDSWHDRGKTVKFSTGTVACIAVALLSVTVRADADLPNPAGPKPNSLWETRCAGCHDHARDRIPPHAFISSIRSPDDILAALSNGVMRQQAAGLSVAEMRSLAVYLTGREPGGETQDPQANHCAAAAPPVQLAEGDWNGWGRDPSNTRFQPFPGIAARDVPRLKLKWAFAFPGNSTYAQPVVVGGRVFAGGPSGRMHALDARSGCTLWTYEAGAVIRTSVVVGTVEVDGTSVALAFFGDDQGVMHAVKAATGARVWSVRVDAHPVARLVGTPRLDLRRLLVPVSSMEEVAAADPKYECCTFRGSLAALDPATGRKLWQSHTIVETPQPFRTNAEGTQQYGPAGGAVFNSPTIDPDRGLIYFGSGDSYTDVPSGGTDAIHALDRASGEHRWVRQVLANDDWLYACGTAPHPNCPKSLGRDLDFASSPLLVRGAHGRTMLIAGAKSGIVYGFDPDDRGRILWSTKIGEGSEYGSILWGLASEGERTFVATNAFDWMAGTGPGALFAIDNRSGKILWRAAIPVRPCAWGPKPCSQALVGAVTAMPGIVFSGALDGRIRAFRSRDGKIVWEFDTGQKFAALNGGMARGGGIDYGAQTIADGMLFVQSGSMRVPGNALLAFSVDGK